MANGTPSVISQILSTVQALANASVDDVAKALGIWASAKAAISTVAGGVAGAAAQTTLNNVLAQYHDIPLSPAALAVAIVRNVISDPTGASGTPPPNYPAPQLSFWDNGTVSSEYAYSGMDANRFAALVGSTGMSYGAIDALRLLNRNKGLWALVPNTSTAPTAPRYVPGTDLGPAWGITPQQFAGVVAHSDIRPEYIPEVLLLARNSVSPATAVEMVVKQIIDDQTGKDLYAAAGGFPEQFDAEVSAAGDSLGPQKMVDLLAHGKITEQYARRALGLTRVNPDFYDAYITSSGGPGPVHDKYLGAYEIGQAVKAGTVDMTTAVDWLETEGYPSDQVTAFITAIAGAQGQGTKAETEAQVLEQYQSGMVTQAQATTALTALHYSPAAITAMLASTEAKSRIASHNAAVSRTKNAYLYGDINAATAASDLAKLGVSQGTATALISDWDVQISTPSRHLSEAQVGHFYKTGVISEATAMSKWEAMGYTATDAALLAGYFTPSTINEAGAGSPAVTAG